jgi:hypothetical protein
VTNWVMISGQTLWILGHTVIVDRRAIYALWPLYFLAFLVDSLPASSSQS